MSVGRIRAAYGQNFLREPATARAIVASAELRTGDCVYEFGAGTGILTHAILRAGARVVAVERDPNLVRKLRRRFAAMPVEIVEADLIGITPVAPYKVVANLPFNRTAAAMRLLFFREPHPDAALLLLQREAAHKYAGIGRLTAVSLMLKPWFDLGVVRTLPPSAFVPRPSVDCALLRIVRRTEPLLPLRERQPWRAFVGYVLSRSKPDARRSFRSLVSNLQWRLLSRDLAISANARLDELTLDQWLGIFRFVHACAPRQKIQRLLTFDATDP